MVLAALINATTSRKVQRSKKECAVAREMAKNHDNTDLKEIQANNVKRDEGRGAIGRGTFGACYLATFHGIYVVFKEFQPRNSTSTGKPSVSSDVYSLAFMIRSLYKFLNFKVNTTVKNAHVTVCESHPSVHVLKESLY